MAFNIKVKKINPDAVLPRYGHPADAGFDFVCLHDATIQPGQTAMLNTGLAFDIPAGYELQVRMRSSGAIETPLIIPNAPGTVDAGYHGEVGILVHNLSDKPFFLRKGERIAQGIISPVVQATLELVDELPPSLRGTAGFGSTGGD